MSNTSKKTRIFFSDLCKRSVKIWLKIPKLHYFILGLSSSILEGTDLGHVRIPSSKDHGLSDSIMKLFFSIHYVLSLFWKQESHPCITHIFHLELLLSQLENHLPKEINVNAHFLHCSSQVVMQMEQTPYSSIILDLKINSRNWNWNWQGSLFVVFFLSAIL